MRMRMKARRGEKYIICDETITFLQYSGNPEDPDDPMDWCRIIGENGKSRAIPVDDLNLPIIDTKDYEKISAMTLS